MLLWAWNGGPVYSGVWWILPLIGLVIMVVMVFACLRMMGGTSGFCCMGGHGDQSAREAEDLQREIEELKHEIESLRNRK